MSVHAPDGAGDAARGWVEATVRPEVRALSAYRVDDATGLVKLDAMENPWPWPAALEQAWLEEVRGLPVNRYPDPSARALAARLREAMHVPEGQGMVLGNGSDELIQTVALAVARPGAVMLAPDPSFAMYRHSAVAVGLDYRAVPLGPGFHLDRAAMLDAIARDRPALVFLAWPNNPTGTLFDREAMESVIDAAPGAVVVDEAYAPFAGASMLPSLGTRPNLLVMRTLSKLGLAGLRLGLVAGPAAWIEEIDKLRLPYNVNALTQHRAEFALRHRHVLEEQAARIRADRDLLHAALSGIDGVTVWPSRANFLLFRVADRTGTEVFEALRAGGVLVKNLEGASPALAGCLRVSVGRPEENEAFLAALRECTRTPPRGARP